MKTEQESLESLKMKQPFRVPEGYMEGLTTHIMGQLPEKERKESRKISMWEQVRPWLYMAAVFAGLGLFFKALVGTDVKDPNKLPDSLLVKTAVTSQSFSDKGVSDDEDFLEYIEDQYAGYLITENWGDSE